MTTIRDVAERAQVSIATVSRVLNEHPSVSPALRRLVLGVIDELQFQPNAIARSLSTAKTRTLGLVMSDLQAGQLATHGVWGAQIVAQERGYALLVADSQYDQDIEARNIRSLVERRVDGLICNPVESSRAVHDLVAGSGVPTVIFGWTVANRVLPTAVLREDEAIKEAVDHLVDLGHRRVSVITRAGPRGTGGPIRERLIHEALRARRINSPIELDRTAASSDACTRAVRDLLTSPRPPTALIVCAHQFLPEVLEGIREAGKGAPEDVSLIAFSDSDWARVVVPPLNVITLDIGAYVEAAARMVVGLIEDQPDLPRVLEHRSRYIRRGSVQSPRDRRRSTTRGTGRGRTDAGWAAK